MNKTHQAIFGIFDGHSGAKASQFCKEVLRNKLEDQYSSLKINTIPTIQKIIKETDEEFLKIAKDHNYTDGSTCVLGVVMNGKLTLANIGDSTALLVKNSNVIELTSEHNYSRLDEFKRVVEQN
mmetsp:Transcript_18923/g.21721  ORF Transcript_18923/g.21721 Transcript_18923/m.21721 type:complete len:124 (-) Transcript_18923:890-1261(-)